MDRSVQLSPETYQILQRQATLLNATVDSLVESAVRQNYARTDTASPHLSEKDAESGGAETEYTSLPQELQDDLDQLAFLTDDELWHVAHTALSAKDHEQMEALLQKQQRTGLNASELAEAESLADRYERTMLVRAKAAVLLKARGHDVSSLGPSTALP